jgi:hypothetical protein
VPRNPHAPVRDHNLPDGEKMYGREFSIDTTRPQRRRHVHHLRSLAGDHRAQLVDGGLRLRQFDAQAAYCIGQFVLGLLMLLADNLANGAADHFEEEGAFPFEMTTQPNLPF